MSTAHTEFFNSIRFSIEQSTRFSYANEFKKAEQRSRAFDLMMSAMNVNIKNFDSMKHCLMVFNRTFLVDSDFNEWAAHVMVKYNIGSMDELVQFVSYGHVPGAICIDTTFFIDPNKFTDL